MSRARPERRNYMTFAALAVYLGGMTKSGARKWAIRNGIPKKWRGKAWLVNPSDVDRALEGEKATA